MQRIASLPTSAATLACLVLANRASPCGGGGFEAGELWLHSAAITGISSSDGGLVRIDPISGVTQQVLSFPAGTSGERAGAYDPYRDRIVLYASIGPSPTDFVTDLYTVDASGATQAMGFPGVVWRDIAPTGDGRVYLSVNSLSLPIRYLDASNQLQTLLDTSGAAPFVWPFAPGNLHRMIYEPASNALFLTSGNTACSGSPTGRAYVYKLPLSADGTRAGGPVDCTFFDVDPLTGEIPENWSRGPGGSLFLVVDTNSNDQQPRMVEVDPTTLAVSVFASNGSYLGAAATNAGVYSHIRGQCLILDTGNDVLRAFSAGETGSGTIVAASGVSAGGSGEAAILFEIGPIGPSHGLAASTNTLSLAAGGTQVLSIDVGAAYAGHVVLVLGTTSGFAPGLLLGSVLLPLNPDGYFQFTLANPNTPPLAASLGLLGAQGQATCTFTLPAGSDPALAGVSAHHAGAILSPALALELATNPIPLTLVP